MNKPIQVLFAVVVLALVANCSTENVDFIQDDIRAQETARYEQVVGEATSSIEKNREATPDYTVSYEHNGDAFRISGQVGCTALFGHASGADGSREFAMSHPGDSPLLLNRLADNSIGIFYGTLDNGMLSLADIRQDSTQLTFTLIYKGVEVKDFAIESAHFATTDLCRNGAKGDWHPVMKDALGRVVIPTVASLLETAIY